MKKIKIIAIAGKSGAGKDSILSSAIKLNPQLNPIISCTTRPKRDNETEGKDYHYLTNEEFAVKLLNGDMLEATSFNGWCYGTSYSTLDTNKINIGVFNPEGLEILKDNPNIILKIFYIDVSNKERLIRQLNREKEPNIEEIIRRYETDEKDFRSFVSEFNCEILKNLTRKDFTASVQRIAGQIF